jgi:ATP-dependent RNA helicase DeaD
MFGGDPVKWRRLANAMQLKVLNVMSKKITAEQKARFAEIVAAGNFADLEIIAAEILKENPDPKTAIAALLKMAFKDELNEKSYNEINELGSYKKNKDFDYDDNGRDGGYRPIGDQGKRGYVDRKGTARLFIAKGRVDNMDPRKLVEFIQQETGVEQRHIDDVKILDNFSFFAASFEDAEKILHVFQKQSAGGRSLVSRAKDKDKDQDGERRSGGRDSSGNRESGGRKVGGGKRDDRR